MNLKNSIRDIPDFPKEGIIYRDITTLLSDHKSFKHTVDKLLDHFKDKKIDKIVSIESRGFIWGAVLAYKLECPFIPARKQGKLPHHTITEEYNLEYGKDALELHKDSILEGENVLIIDDLLATGGTVSATCKLVERLGGIVQGIAVIVELTSLPGRDRLSKYEVVSLVEYEGE